MLSEIIQFFSNNKLLTIAAVAIILELLWIVILQINLSLFKRRTGKVTLGESGKRLEEMIYHQTKTIQALDKDIHELYTVSNKINNLALRGLHKVAMVRFNPFNDLGGDQSFSIALLNGKNNGLVLSSLYTREGTRIFSKSIISGKSEKHPLTNEEEQVVKTAMASDMRKVR